MLPELTRHDVLRLETRRLWLRWPEQRDAAAITSFTRLEQVAIMTATCPHPLPDGEAARRIAAMRLGNGEGSALTLVLTPKSRPDHVIGVLGGKVQADSKVLGIGYMLAPEVWGRGVMTEAVAGYVSMLFRISPVARFETYVRTINPASRRVLEKVGFNHVRSGVMDMPARGAGIAVDWFQFERQAWRQRVAYQPHHAFGRTA